TSGLLRPPSNTTSRWPRVTVISTGLMDLRSSNGEPVALSACIPFCPQFCPQRQRRSATLDGTGQTDEPRQIRLCDTSRQPTYSDEQRRLGLLDRASGFDSRRGRPEFKGSFAVTEGAERYSAPS